VEEPLSAEDLIGLLRADSRDEARNRQDAIAWYLSGEDGWRDAMKQLTGAFAAGVPRLKERKGD
jgi:hypothetical protein